MTGRAALTEALLANLWPGVVVFVPVWVPAPLPGARRVVYGRPTGYRRADGDYRLRITIKSAR